VQGSLFLPGRLLFEPRHKEIKCLGQFFRKKEKNLLFLKKKKQKDFYSCAGLILQPEGALGGDPP
jgi:hypothetical protein